ncbi:MAG: 16S rRNA (cytidine(1402)-2'-O)-methyltransferase [Roseobacter sp.]
MNFEKVKLATGVYFIGVPIGTARDITLRALDVLASADVLAAEDTRSLRRLMDIHGVPLAGRKIVALHDHSSARAASGLVAAAQAGKSVAYASEAGMPLIADPGFELGRLAAEHDVPVTCAPGPSAVLTALVLAGLPTDAFFFAGFLPNARSARHRRLTEIESIPGTLVFYESPKRLGEMLADAAQTLGADRQGVVCRELTKKFEELRKDTLGELSAFYAEAKTKGEVVVLIDRQHSEKISENELKDALAAAMEGNSMRDAVDLVATAHDVPRRQVYQLGLALSKAADD